ncbi:MAG: 50S ribosomal protein L29 [Porphyromonas sp.]|uniref:50S ribosomal protein L29 n=1 Tax=Porphyromonas sp. TaxID=1924944 RepID=UPI001A466D97|nr:50S ribosomal protein L29 [Porphyromonas sp.]MBL6452778.1 50S ribosomal protein L29 [Porphyromonas sp.]
MQISEINEFTTEEIRERIETEQASYQQKRIDHYVSPAENPAAFREQRRTIARLKTVLAQREVQNNPAE